VKWKGYEGDKDKYTWEHQDNLRGSKEAVAEYYRLYPGKSIQALPSQGSTAVRGISSSDAISSHTTSSDDTLDCYEKLTRLGEATRKERARLQQLQHQYGYAGNEMEDNDRFAQAIMDVRRGMAARDYSVGLKEGNVTVAFTK
jgi:hypothetical protein